ncbi:MAG TPA: tetratricopeptide repeat protein [Pseudomonas xinjiangensis]|uniref:Tetratricopeptide repeat protein n=2 Tax=root TaxID=1 RepID=A0A7V1BQ55_9GAMM|nr:tetratricopeptide repeat protein [Halopseudomonas xinjiangensis]HEC48800.1 tetratricopeptide repeat protein [Halopseudomonas xinjiangensis]
MRNSSASKPVSLLRPWTLALSTAAMGGLLVLTYNSEEVFLPDGQRPDAVSANYAELLLSARPGDVTLRLELVELLVELAQYDRARLHLLNWPEPDPLLAEYYRLTIDGLVALHAGDAQRLAWTRTQLFNFDRSGLPAHRLQKLAELALRMEMPWLAADVFHDLSQRLPEQRVENLKAASRWYLASNQPGKASMIYLDLLATSDKLADGPDYLRLAYDALLAVGADDHASRLLTDELHLLSASESDAAWLKQGVRVATNALRYDLAEQILRHWQALQPNNAEVLAAEFRMRLASGDIHDAWRVGQLLLAMRSEDLELLQDMARLGEWTGNNPQALSYWIRYLDLREDPAVREHAWRLAFQVYDFDRGIALLVGQSPSQRLSDEKLDALIYAQESRGTPDQSEEWLRNYLHSHPGHRLAWLRLIQNLENTHQHGAEADIWQAMATHFPLSTVERIDWASLHWKLYQPQLAWTVLNANNHNEANPDYWRTLAGLAWDLEKDQALHAAYERMLEEGITLTFSEETQLMGFYREVEPRRALEMQVASWERTGDVRRLVDSLDLAQTLADKDLLGALLENAGSSPSAMAHPGVLLARGAFAELENRTSDAELIYKSGLERFPNDSLIRERLLWFYIDHSRHAELPMLLHKWRPFAARSGSLWLPFATANQLLGRHDQALAWFRRYLRSNPNDWLVQAAYVDALEASGRFDQAQRLRRALAANIKLEPGSGSPERYAVWLRLFAAAYSPRQAQGIALRWQDGSTAMLQLWFDRLIYQLESTNQETQKDQWLAWGRARGLKIDRYDHIQEALRTYNRATLQSLLANSDLDPAQRVEALNRLGRSGQALGTALSGLGHNQPGVIREQLRRQAVELHQRKPQGLQLSWGRQDFGGLKIRGPKMTLARNLGNDWYASLVLSQVHYQADSVDLAVIGPERNLELLLGRELESGGVSLTVDLSIRNDQDRHGFGVSRSWQLTANDQLALGIDWQRESRESGLMRALGAQDSLWLAGRHGFTARDQFSWSLAHRRYETRYGEALGNGRALSMELTQVQEFDNPTWVTRTGIDYQRNDLRNGQLLDLLGDAASPLRLDQAIPQALLQEEYGRFYVGSSLHRGFPGALNRSHPQYTWLIDVLAGWQWTDSTFTYGINAGVGAELVGDDELAFTVGYQSAPRGGEGEPGGTLNLIYSTRFGR